jgi:hypothetical protein
MPEGKRPLGKPKLREWIILKWFLKKYDAVIQHEFIWLRIGTSGGLTRP